MRPQFDNLKAVCFDLGNTLIEFGPKQVSHEFGMLEKTLTSLFGSCDSGRLKAVRDRQIVAPFSNNYKENDFRELSAELIRALYGMEPNENHVEAIMQTRYQSMINVIVLPEGVLSLLNKLKKHYAIGLLSNYPYGKSVRDSLKKLEILDCFDSITISGEIGLVKPHKKAFETMLSALNRKPSESVYIGDNWLADIQGSKSIGMKAILTSQFLPYEIFNPKENDFLPDARIRHFKELEELLF